MKIYLVLSVNSLSGGGNSMHQLAEILIKKNQECYLYFYDEFKGVSSKFDKYKIPKVSKIEDNSENVIIVPETLVPFLNTVKNVKKVIWWLSFDFYYYSFPEKKIESFLSKYSLPNFFYPFVEYYSRKTKKIPGFLFNPVDLKTEGNEIFHLYNCEYVKNNLLSWGISEKNMQYLCGPLEEIFFKDEKKVKVDNLVLYNPAKGLDYTKKIIRKSKEEYPNIKFKPLTDMNRLEFVQVIKSSKLYIDFGFFPGPERIPREAVMMNCNIMTSRLGAAQNQIDVPIPNYYKFEDNDENLPVIVDKISYLLSNYEKHISDFDEYREKIIKQKTRFDEDIDSFINILNQY